MSASELSREVATLIRDSSTVHQALQSLHTSKIALHESLEAVFRLLNLLSSRGVAIATSLHFRRGSAAEHFFRGGEEDEVERAWMELRAEVESARETMGRLEKAVGGAGNRFGQRGDLEASYSSRPVR